MVPTWEVDWEKYWEQFKLKHGNHPVQLDEWVVFEDGWRHDAYDPGGTELPPPEGNALRFLLIAYYAERRAVIRQEFFAMRQLVDDVARLVEIKNCPLPTRNISWSRVKAKDGFDEYRPSLHEDSLDSPLHPQLRNARGRLAWLQQDMDRCKRRIEELLEQTESQLVEMSQ